MSKFEPIYLEIDAEYERAALKHPGMTLDADGQTDLFRLAALTEEIGEVATAITYDRGDVANLREELIQVAGLAIAWAHRL